MRENTFGERPTIRFWKPKSFVSCVSQIIKHNVRQHMQLSRILSLSHFKADRSGKPSEHSWRNYRFPREQMTTYYQSVTVHTVFPNSTTKSEKKKPHQNPTTRITCCGCYGFLKRQNWIFKPANLVVQLPAHKLFTPISVGANFHL